MKLVAHPLVKNVPEIVPAPRARRFNPYTANMNRCLPFTIANQSGWWVLNPAPFTARCDPETGIVSVEYEQGWKVPNFPAKHHFGGGVLTIDLPFLWETEPGWDLHIRGPANYPLPGAYCFEGIIESDWAKIPVPSNWQLEPGRFINFKKDFPVCQIVPVKHGTLQDFKPVVEYSEQALADAHKYYKSREDDYVLSNKPTTRLTGYFKGEDPDGTEHPTHLKNINLKEFTPYGN